VRWVIKGIYRVYFHPLRTFPGPKFCAFTRIPHLLAVNSGTPIQFTRELHDRYGDVVRISPDELSFADPQAWRDIYGHGSRNGKGSTPPKHWSWYERKVNGASSLLDLQESAEHARARKIFTPAFSDRALMQQQVPIFAKYADQLVETLRNGRNFDFVRMFNFTTFDIMGDFTFGESMHMLDNAEYDPWVNIIFQNVKRGVKFNLIHSYYPLVGYVVRVLFGRIVERMKYEHFGYCVTRVTKRLEKGRASEGVDLWDLVLKQGEDGERELRRDEMDVNADLFMIAGTETIATLLSGLTYLLLTHPESMEKLVAEIRGAFAASSDIDLETTRGLPYFNACIKEALRKYPPVPVALPHLTPAQGSTICGHYVPPNVSHPALHYLLITLIGVSDHCRGISLGHLSVPQAIQRPAVFYSRALDR
jgi:cytochrome P450